MKVLYMVITNGGDGSNSVEWVQDGAVLARMEELADDGDECYASGDGLQVRKLMFPETFDLDAFFEANHIRLVTLKDLGDI